VYGVNPVTGVPCTTRVVVTAEDVTLWQVDQKIESEAAFDAVDTDNVGMVCLPHEVFKEILRQYRLWHQDQMELGITTLEEEAEQDALAAQGIADEEAEAKARAEHEAQAEAALYFLNAGRAEAEANEDEEEEEA